MSSYSILDTYSGTLVSSLQARYNNVDCGAFIDDLSYTYANYYAIKKTNYVTSNLITRKTAADTAVGTYKGTITTLGNTMTSVKTNL